MRNLLSFFTTINNLLVVDLNSIAVDFYFQENAIDLAELDFSKLERLAERKTKAIKNNLLFSKEELQTFLNEELRILKNSGKNEFKLVFIVSPESTEIERKALKKIASSFVFRNFDLVDRHFFYHQFLMQQKNFSKEKLILSIFENKVELSLFKDQKLVFSREFDGFSYLRTEEEKFDFLSKRVEDFLFDFSLKKQGKELKLEYIYLFDRGFLKNKIIDSLSRNLKLELIRTKSLC